MLTTSLVMSGVVLLAVNAAARYAKNPVGVAVGWSLGGLVCSGMCFAVFPAVAIQSLVLIAGVLLATAIGWGARAITPVSLVAVLVGYGSLWVSAERRQQEQERLLAAYPFESLDERLPRAPQGSLEAYSDRLNRLEDRIDRELSHRSRHLQRLHAGNVDRFANSAGFGVGRMARVEPTESSLKPEPREDAPPQQDYFRPTMPTADRRPALPPRHALDGLHDGGVLDFVNPRGFGYFKDRRHVAGFQSHGFSRAPEAAGEWKVSRLELVGLLRHESPVVYVSAKLPLMDELRDAPTRPLDPFEQTALAALRGGADSHTADGPDGLRFLGAIRSTKQCVECHGGERGALLGAFSYHLRPGP